MLSVELQPKDENVRVTYGNACRDLSPDDLPFIFERFYRVDEARSRRAGGTGLGLAIVKHYALATNSRVEVRSEHGKGSTFTIVLPARKR